MNTVIRQFAADLYSDVGAYQALADLLELQFTASLGQQTAQLSELLQRISTLLAEIELRRQRRSKIIKALSPHDARCEALISTLPTALQGACLQQWQQLARLLKQAKALNQRNGEFILSQQEIMQRVLFGEQDIYDPL